MVHLRSAATASWLAAIDGANAAIVEALGTRGPKHLTYPVLRVPRLLPASQRPFLPVNVGCYTRLVPTGMSNARAVLPVLCVLILALCTACTSGGPSSNSGDGFVGGNLLQRFEPSERVAGQ